MARELEVAGFESVWVGDHVAMPSENASRYPFSPGGVMPWAPTDDWSDSVVALASMAEGTTSIRIGTGVMVAALRNPVVLAKQLATIDVLSGGRIEFGVGAGWLTEEFAIVGLDARNRGRRLDEAVAMIRRCWQGSPDAFAGEFYALPEGSLFYPVPAHEIPVIIGGMSERAYERTVRFGSGWMATTSVAAIQQGALDPIARIRRLASEGGRDPDSLAYIARVNLGAAADVEPLVDLMPTLVHGGVTELVVDIPWGSGVDLADWHERLRVAAGGPGQRPPQHH